MARGRPAEHTRRDGSPPSRVPSKPQLLLLGLGNLGLASLGPASLGRMRSLTVVFAATLVAAGLAAAGTHAIARKPLRVTFVGDSVPDSITYVPAARRRLTKGFVFTLDLRVCRRLVARSCSFQGSTPSTALDAIRAFGTGLGDVLVVDVGYNEGPVGYGTGIDRVMRAAHAQGAVGVVWVTLRETRNLYRETNAVIRKATKRWPQLRVADWNAFSSGRSWFAGDHLHLTPTGATALAGFLRPYILRAGGR